MLIVMTLLAVALMAVAYRKDVIGDGFTAGAKLLVQVGPILVVAFVVAGMVSVLVSPEWLQSWLGREAGLRGLLLGTAAGAVTPGGPFIAFPLLAVLLKGGVGVGVVTSYLTAWALLGLHRIVAFEIPIFGWRFVACRIVASLAFPIVIGWAAQVLWTRFGPS